MNKVYRSWGWYEILVEGKGWKLKRLIVSPKKKSSLQRHFKRNEVWFYPDNNEFSFVLWGTWHQLINDSDFPLEIIELQFGLECIEEDIERRE